MSRCPSEISFVSFLQYSPRGQGEISVKSQAVRDAIKNDGLLGGVRVIDHAAKRIREHLEQHAFLKRCFGEDATLVPVPRSAPFKDPESLWPAERICQELLDAQGLGAQGLSLLRRKRAVKKSAWAAPGERPGPDEHYDSFEVDPNLPLESPTRITLVDDFITRGATLLGAYARVAEAFPGVEINSFALVRTMSRGEVEELISPVEGKIIVRNGEPFRDP